MQPSFMVGHPIEDELALKFKLSGSNGAIHFPSQSVLLRLDDLRIADLTVFRGEAFVRVLSQDKFMILSIAFASFEFDIVWCPTTAWHSDEELFDPGDEGSHSVFNFIMLDGDHIVRGIRSATIDWPVARAIQRAQKELMAKEIDEAEMTADYIALFRKYPKTIPMEVFHEICALGD